MRHEDEGAADLAMDAAQFLLHPMAQLEIERRQRLVEQQDLGAHDESAGKRDALLLTAREAVDAALAERFEAHQAQRLCHTGDDLLARPFLQRKAEAHILGDGQVGKEPVALEHHVGRPLFGAEPGDVLSFDGNRPP